MKKRLSTPLTRFLFIALALAVVYFWKQPTVIQDQVHSTQRNSDFISSFLGFPLKLQWFLILEGLIILLWIVNGIMALINAKKLDDYLRENNFSRWAELHNENGNPNYAYHAYIWGSKDNENEVIYRMKIKDRWGFILIFSPLMLTGVNIFIFTYIFHVFHLL